MILPPLVFPANKVPLSSLLFLDVYGFHTADSKPVKQEVNGTVIPPPLVFPGVYLSPGYFSFV